MFVTVSEGYFLSTVRHSLFKIFVSASQYMHQCRRISVHALIVICFFFSKPNYLICNFISAMYVTTDFINRLLKFGANSTPLLSLTLRSSRFQCTITSLLVFPLLFRKTVIDSPIYTIQYYH